jgi:hypothetical protein
MKQIEKIKTVINYKDGIFDSKNMQIIAKVLNELIKKSNQQTEAINALIEKSNNSTVK